MINIACFDVGGTFIKYGVISEDGSIIYENKATTPKYNCKTTIIELLTQLSKDMKQEYNVSLIGVSTAGKVKNGEIMFASNLLPDYTGARVKEEIEERTGMTCEVDNDAYCAALGEMWKGGAVGYKNFAMLTFGTGIGGAVVINGELYKGINLGAMGIGHLIINNDGIECSCNCGMRGTYEAYASIPSLLKGVSASGEEFTDLLKKGDKRATERYKCFLNDVTNGLFNVVHLLDTGLVLIGGGFMEQDFVIKDIQEKFKKDAHPFYKNTIIKGAVLGNFAGLYGAAYSAINNYK